MLFLYGMHKRDKGRGQSRKNSAIIIKIIIPSRLWLLVYFSSDSPSLLDRHCQGLVRTSQEPSQVRSGQVRITREEAVSELSVLF